MKSDLSELDDLIVVFATAKETIREQAAEVLGATAERVADTQRAATRSSRNRDRITVRTSRSGMTAWVGPGFSPRPDANLPWIEEYGTARQAPHPFILGSASPHIGGLVEELGKVAGRWL